jgi:predicted DNA-binding transcriptional regulator AlpA
LKYLSATTEQVSEKETVRHMNIPKYIDEREVAKITGFALSTLRNNRFKGEGISYVKVGRSVRYNLEDVVAFMEAHRVQTGMRSVHNLAAVEVR